MSQCQRFLLLKVCLLAATSAAHAQGLMSVDNYLDAVRSGNAAFVAADKSAQAANDYKSQARTTLWPTLFTSASDISDAKASSIPGVNYSKRNFREYKLGLEQDTLIGLRGSFYYTLSETEFVGTASPYSEGQPVFELTQSLWRNSFGREARAKLDALRERAESREHTELFNKQQILVNAEVAYWRLSLARQKSELSRENLVRAEKNLEWSRRRVRLSLADRSDLLQSEALLKARQIDLKLANNELRSAALNFNSARGRVGQEVPETLEPISGRLIENFKVPEKPGDRQDVLAAKSQSELARAEAISRAEENRPILELFGSYGFNSREDERGEAFSESWAGKKETRVVGIRFRSPLNFSAQSEANSGWNAEAQAAEIVYERRRFLQSQDWQDQVNKFSEAKERLKDFEELESVQREKLENERKRHELGRSTLFTVLDFEVDYLNAQSARLGVLAELLQIRANLKLFGAL